MAPFLMAYVYDVTIATGECESIELWWWTARLQAMTEQAISA